MQYTTDFSESTQVCKVALTGEFSRPDDSAALRELIVSLAVQHGTKRFLVDMSQAEIEGEWREAASAITDYQDPEHTMAPVRVAVVYASNLSDNKLLESTASAKGYLMAVFDDVEKATEWLTHST